MCSGMLLDHRARGARSPRRAARRPARRAAPRAGLPTTARATSTSRRSRAPSVPTLTSGSDVEADERRARPARPRGARRGRPLASARAPARRCRRPTAPRSPARSGTCAAGPSARAGSAASRAGPRRRPCTRPAAGSTKPLSTLKNVVLPAPLGPISPQVPAGKVTVMPSSGVTPPKRTVRSSISITRGLLGRPAARRSGRAIRRPELAPCPSGTGRRGPAGAVSSTCRTPTPNRIVSRSAGRPQLSSRAGRQLEQQRPPRSPPRGCRCRPSARPRAG